MSEHALGAIAIICAFLGLILFWGEPSLLDAITKRVAGCGL